MQISKVYTIKDTVGEMSSPPFCAVNDQVAKRQMVQLVGDTEFKEDFKLYCLGEYNHDTMFLVTNSIPEEVI